MQSFVDHAVELVSVALCFYVVFCLSKQKIKQVCYVGGLLMLVVSLKITNGDSLYQAFSSIHSYDDFRNMLLPAIILTAILTAAFGFAAKQLDNFFNVPKKKSS